MMPIMPGGNFAGAVDFQNGPGHYGGMVTNEMMNSNQRQNFGPITLSNGAVYTGELLNAMKDGYGA